MRKKIIMLFIFALTIILLGSCSVGSGGGLTIENIISEQLDNGDVRVTVFYYDDLEEPHTFTINKAKDGIDGKGISDIEIDNQNNERPHTTKLVIKFDEGYLDDYPIYIPNGVGIEGIDDSYDEDGNLVFRFLYTDSSYSDEIVVKRGIEGKSAYEIALEQGFEGTEEEWLDTLIGKDGLSLYDVQFEKLDSEHMKYYLYFTDLGRDLIQYDESGAPLFDPTEIEPVYVREFVLEIKRGISIADIESTYSEDNMEYGLKITLDDGSVFLLDFQRMNTIFTGLYGPQPNQGIIGDYYFSTVEKTMYMKDESGWEPIYNLNKERNLRVTFNLNAGNDPTAKLNYPTTYVMIAEGQYLGAKEYGLQLPQPTRSGYKFNGWYLVANPIPEISGRFTDTTPVYRDMDLYADWIVDAE